MRVRLTSRAYRDLADIADYLGSENPPAARRVANQIRRSLRTLGRFSLIGRPSGIADIRQYQVPRLPYLIMYRLAGDTVEILTIFHTSRNPDDKWL